MILLLGLLIAIGGAVVLWRQWKRERDLEKQKRSLRLLLQQMVHALRIGAGFQQALERAGREGEGELSAEWRRLYHGLQMGRSLREGLVDLMERVELREVRWFATAVNVSGQTGGSLANVLDILVTTLREREALRDKVAALTAQGKASAVILGLLPFLLLITLRIIAPDIVQPLFVTSRGQGLLALMLFLLAVGALVMQRIIRLPVDS